MALYSDNGEAVFIDALPINEEGDFRLPADEMSIKHYEALHCDDEELLNQEMFARLSKADNALFMLAQWSVK
jgi:hypothetical protein